MPLYLDEITLGLACIPVGIVLVHTVWAAYREERGRGEIGEREPDGEQARSAVEIV